MIGGEKMYLFELFITIQLLKHSEEKGDSLNTQQKSW